MLKRFVLAVAAAGAALAGAQPALAPSPEPERSRRLPVHAQAVEGVFSHNHVCGHGEGGHHGCKVELWLTTPGGERHRLELDEALAASLPPLHELRGEFMRAQLSQPMGSGPLKVKNLSHVPREYWPKGYTKEVSLAASSNQRMDPQLGTKKYIFILAKFKDTTAEPHTMEYYDTLIGNSAGGLGNWFSKISYGRMDINGSGRIGWITLPKTKAEYQGSGANVDFAAVVRDAAAAVDGSIDFREYYGINVMANTSIGFAKGLGGGVTLTLDGTTRVWGATVNGLHTVSLLAHEMGHSLGLGHSGDTWGNEYGSLFDVMGSGGAMGYHAAYRWFLDWIPSSKVSTVLPGAIRTIRLERRSDPVDAASHQAIVVYQPGFATRYWVLEYINGGAYENPGIRGVVLTEVDELRASSSTGVDVVRVVDANNNNNLKDAGSLFVPGQTYSDVAAGYSFTVSAATATAVNVQVSVNASVPLANRITSLNDTGAGTLREALVFASRNPAITPSFRIPGAQLTSGVARFRPRSRLPIITGSNISFDGFTQTGAIGNTNPSGPEVVIDGTEAGDFVHGLEVRGANNTIRGLNIQNFKASGILITGAGATGNKVFSNYIGTDPTGLERAKNAHDGVAVTRGAKGTIIGSATGGNLISGNVFRGIGIWDADSDDTVIENNIIGGNRHGTGALVGAEGMGISVVRGPKRTRIQNNTLGGNAFSGIELFGAVTDTQILGNRIGASLSGNAKLKNNHHGLVLNKADTDAAGPSNTTVGGTASGQRNIFGGSGFGSLFLGGAATGTKVQGNWIGIAANGTTNIGSDQDGMVISGAHGTLVGGAASGEGNVIGFTAGHGIWMRANDVIIRGNRIGFTPSGTPAAVTSAGIVVDASLRTRVGGDTSGAGNIIGHTGARGIAVFNGDSGFIQGNWVGVAPNGTTAAPVVNEAILLAAGSSGNLIGGATAAARNVVGSALVGIGLWDTGTTFNRVEGNFAGLGPNGSLALPLTQSGILMATNSSGNTIGGTGLGVANLVANCGFEGIGVFKSTGNSILGNSIGRTTTNGAAPVENGILLNDGSANNEVRTNVIFRVRKQGINLFKATGNTVQGNIIGFASDQLTAGGIGERGILINELSHNNTIGGAGSGQGNRIGNALHGVHIFRSNNNLLQGNIIGINANNVRAPITGDGVGIFNASSDNRVGGGTVASGNTIRGASRGVVVQDATSLRNSIRVNRISGNAALGIDLLGTGGVTSNDNTDADVGPNGLTNFPQILGLVFSGGNLTVNGALAAKPATAYTIDVYYSTAADASGFGEGEVWVSSIPVVTNSVGTVTFSQIINTIPAGTHVSMTATGPEGTSEFCRSALRS